MENKGKFNKADVMLEKEWYKKEAIRMLQEIRSESHIKMIYGFVKELYLNR